MTLGVIVGRFQVDELHVGHKTLINYVSQNCDAVLIVVGYSRSLDYRPDKSNPLPSWIRSHYLAKQYPNFMVGQVIDQRDDLKWSECLDAEINFYRESIGSEDPVILFGGRDSFLSHYKGQFPVWELPESYKVEESATRIRMQLSEIPSKTSLSFRRGIIHSVMNRPEAVYPTVDIAIVTKDQTRNKWMIVAGKKPGWNQWRLPGGFVDTSDDSYEAAAVREMSEETGISVDRIMNLPYFLGSFRVDVDWRYKGPDVLMTSLFLIEVPYDTVVKASDDLSTANWLALDTMGRENPIVVEHIPLFEKVQRYMSTLHEVTGKYYV